MNLGFRAEILTGPFHSPNDGLSAHARHVTIVGPEVPEELRIFKADDDAPAVLLQRRPWAGDLVLVPLEKPQGAFVGPMASGAYAVNSDDRWEQLTGGSAPIALHDRFESVELYNALSN